MIARFFLLLYNIWCGFWFIGIFLVLFPFIFVCIQVKSWHKYGNKLCNLWADIFFPIVGMPVHIEYEMPLDSRQNYIFVANHFSYLDVAIGMKIVRHYFSYMGKASVKQIPLLGYMFAKLHIQVDRSDKDSRSKAIIRSQNALKQGRSLFIMPEGGIISATIPLMHKPLKDGAFNLAIDAQVPIVPISILNLDEIMPATTIRPRQPRVFVHAPISTKGMDKSGIESLKDKVYDTIQNSINSYKNGH